MEEALAFCEQNCKISLNNIIIEIAYIETSALTAQNVDKAFKNLVTEIYKITKAQTYSQSTTGMLGHGMTTGPLGSQNYEQYLEGEEQNTVLTGKQGKKKDNKVAGGMKLSVLKHSQVEQEKEKNQKKKNTGCC